MDIASYVADQPAKDFPGYLRCMELFSLQIMTANVSFINQVLSVWQTDEVNANSTEQQLSVTAVHEEVNGSASAEQLHGPASTPASTEQRYSES